MTLLDILLHELENWPAGKAYAFQSATTPLAYFASSDQDSDLKTIYLCQIAPNRGPNHKVTYEEWKAAKVKALPYFPEVSSVLGEERAVKELLAVEEINYAAKELDEAFVFADTPQGFDFWKNISEPNRGANKLKHALNTITAAMSSGHFIRLHSDGSGAVCDADDERVHCFASTDDLVEGYLANKPKFDHWHLLTEEIKWIAKDSDGVWWAYVDQPNLGSDRWYSAGNCSSLDILKFDIPCHWKRSLIERPSPLLVEELP